MLQRVCRSPANIEDAEESYRIYLSLSSQFRVFNIFTYDCPATAENTVTAC